MNSRKVYEYSLSNVRDIKGKEDHLKVRDKLRSNFQNFRSLRNENYPTNMGSPFI